MQGQAARKRPVRHTAMDCDDRIWAAMAAARILGHMPATEAGWDARPWEGDKALVRSGGRLDEFRAVFGGCRGGHRVLAPGDPSLRVPTAP